jgi:hypothetical protein
MIIIKIFIIKVFGIMYRIYLKVYKYNFLKFKILIKMKFTLLTITFVNELFLLNCQVDTNAIFLKSNVSSDKENNTNTLQQIRSEGLDIGTIVGISVGGVFLIIILLAFFFICRKRPAPANSQQHSSNKEQKPGEVTNEFDKNSVGAINLVGNNKDLPNESKNTTMMTANKTIGITDRPFLDAEKKLEYTDRDMFSDDGSMKRRMENQNAEASFKIAIGNIDSNTKDDKMKELALNSPKYIPNKIIDIKSFEDNFQEKTTKDIITNNIYNYTEGKREDFYTEGSRNYDETFSQHDDASRASSNRRESNVYKIKFDKRRVSINEEKEMTPEEHSDFLDGDSMGFDSEGGVKVAENYNSVHVSKLNLDNNNVINSEINTVKRNSYS